MANKSRFVIAESSIRKFFDTATRKVYSKEKLEEVLEKKRIIWNLPISMDVYRFADKLIKSKILQLVEVNFTGYLSQKDRYILFDTSPFQLAVSLIHKSYLSHFTAAYYLGLTNQIPKTIYVTFEQSKKNIGVRKLDQDSIDAAFSKPQRKSNTSTHYDEYTFLMHNGMYTNLSGVFMLDDLPITNLERTLIDITVRPDYSGGVDSVLDIYKNALDKVSVNKLIAILDTINFIYPYHQTIGFYLERAGCDHKKLDILLERKMPYKFYLTYEMIDKKFDHKWNIYYPNGM